MPDDFANRIGRLLEMLGGLEEPLFDPQSLRDLLTELAASDEANGRDVTIQVIQRPGGGTIRRISVAPIDRVSRGATVLNWLHHTDKPVDPAAFQRVVPLLAGLPAAGAESSWLLETGIKVIHVMFSLAAGGTVAIAGEYGAGTTMVVEELVRHLSGGTDRVSLFALLQHWDGEGQPGFSHVEELKKDGFSEGTVGAVQTSFFFGAEEGPGPRSAWQASPQSTS